MKTLIFLVNDPRWSNLRDYYTDKYGKEIITFIFGIIISLICPFLFVLQNFLLGLCINNGRINLENVKRVLKTTKTQIILIYDMSLFCRKNENDSGNILELVKLPIGSVILLGKSFTFVFKLLNHLFHR